MTKKVEQEAKEIMDKFMKSMKKAMKDEAEFSIEREHTMRTHEEECDASFHDRFLAIVPAKDGDFVLGEKRKWK